MKKRFKLENLDCANCAAKMERNIQKVNGVINASVSFMFQRLEIEAHEEDFERIMAETEKICKKIEPDMKICK